jgi:protein-S-isoprenylcysteine O-methyltransferase
MTLPPLAILAPLWGLAEFCTAVMTRSRGVGPSKDRGSVFLLWAVCLSSIGLAVFAANRFSEWALPNPRLCFGAALCLFALGIVFRSYSIIYLGRFFTPDVAIAADHRLIDLGPYRFIRHPTYTGLLMIVLGVALSFANVASLLIVFVPVLACVLWRIRIEEQALTVAFGEEYPIYMRRTKRLIPFIY